MTVEIEANGSTCEINPSLVGSLDSSCCYKRLLFCFGRCSRPNFFFSTHTVSLHLSRSPGKLDTGQ
jgi:hypothetical protein